MVSLVLLLAQAGCVTRGTWQALQTEHEGVLAERERLETENERLQIERDAYESQFLDAQESLEDERVVRASLASDLETVSAEAASLDESLDAERRAHLAAAAALAARETELASMQSTYDELVGDLEAEVSAGQIEIERLREGLRLNVSEKVLFASGSASLDETGRQVLVKVAERLSNLTDFVEVRGHTDDVRIRSTLAKRYPTNWELAAARAARVVRLLEEQGVPGSRLAVISLGPNEPIASNDTAEGRARNRRIEIRLIPSRSAHSGKRASEPDAPGPEEAEPEAEPAAPQAADARVGG
jgi:chemotaxis protein MotB